MLDNPLWASLTTSHRALAYGGAGALRYPAEVAPFVAVAEAGGELGGLVAPGETLYAVGPRPAGALDDLGTILQMVCDRPPPVPDGPRIVELGPAQRADLLALAARVYPHYVRPRTPELGRYLGIYDGATLAAMAGLRMAMPGHRELSAICTHPDHVGRGLARRLLAVLTAEVAAQGDVPFLHVSPNNARAIRLYEQNGYRTRIAIAFAAVRR